MRRNKAVAAPPPASRSDPPLAPAAAAADDEQQRQRAARASRERRDHRQGPRRQGPAAEVEGASTGGTITVSPDPDDRPEHLDPTDGWSVTGNSIQQALTHRSLTQYRRDTETGEMVLVPDLATDLGTPNEDFTEWTFTISDDTKWEDGKPITAEEVAWGIKRSLDAEAASRPAPAPSTRSPTSWAATSTTVPTPARADYKGVTVERHDGDHQDVQPFPDMDYWGAFMAMGPSPLGKVSDPPDYGLAPAVDRPLQDRVVPPERGARPRQERPLGPRLRPGPSPVRRQVGSSSSTATTPRPTRLCSATTVADDPLGHDLRQNYTKFNQDGSASLVLVGAACTGFGRPTTRRSPSWRSARPWRTPTRTRRVAGRR